MIFCSITCKSGEVCIIPYANPLGWLRPANLLCHCRQVFRHWRTGYQPPFSGQSRWRNTGKDLRRINVANPRLWFAIDLHTSKMSNPFAIYTKPNMKKYIRLCGFTYNQYSDDASIPPCTAHSTPLWTVRELITSQLNAAGMMNMMKAKRQPYLQLSNLYFLH